LSLCKTTKPWTMLHFLQLQSYQVWRRGFTPTEYGMKMFKVERFAHVQAGSSPAGGQWCPAPPFEIGAPPFHVWPTGCCIHPILYFKNVSPPSGFWLPLLLNPGSWPVYRVAVRRFFTHPVFKR